MSSWEDKTCLHPIALGLCVRWLSHLVRMPWAVMMVISFTAMNGRWRLFRRSVRRSRPCGLKIRAGPVLPRILTRRGYSANQEVECSQGRSSPLPHVQAGDSGLLLQFLIHSVFDRGQGRFEPGEPIVRYILSDDDPGKSPQGLFTNEPSCGVFGRNVIRDSCIWTVSRLSQDGWIPF